MKPEFKISLRHPLWKYAFLLAVTLGCGYRLVRSTVPGGGSSVHIPSVANQTAYGGLSGALTTGLRRETAKRGIRVAAGDRSSAFPRLEVAIVRVEGQASLLTVQNQRVIPAENIIDITVSAKLIAADGKLLAGPFDFSCGRNRLAGQNALVEETLAESARQELLMKLASRVASRFFDSL